MDQQHISFVEKIYRQHKNHIYNYIHRLCKDAELANDIVQTTFIKLLSDPDIADVEQLKAYLFTIARNQLFDEMKRKKPVYYESSEQAEEAAGDSSDENSLYEQTEEQALAKAVDKAIAHMPEKFRELMLLRYTEDLSIQEIADITHRNLSDIKVNLHRARLAFESRFTATMYTKVAASRSRCDTLMNMIAPFGNNDIPMGEIPKIETHITKCSLCNEDATQLKHRRELFTLLPVSLAPELWHDIVKEAKAAETGQSDAANSASHANEQASSVKAGANAINAAAKISVVKVASVTIVALTIVISGVMLWKKLPVTTPPAVTQPAVSSQTILPPPLNPATQSNSKTTTAPNSVANNAVTQNPPPAGLAAQAAPTTINSNTPATGKPSPQVAMVAPAKSSARPPAKGNKKASDFWHYDGPPQIITTNDTGPDGSDEVNVHYKSRLGIRTETTDQANGEKHILMASFKQRKGYIVDPESKIYVDLQLDDNGNSKIFPVFNDEDTDSLLDKKPCEKYDLTKRLGTESLQGKMVEKWACGSSKNGDTILLWYDPVRKMVVGEEDSTSGKSVLQNISEQPIDPSKFEIPADYKLITMREYYDLKAQPQSISYDNAMSLYSFARCAPDCTEKQTECHVKLQPQCDNAQGSSQCYASCDEAYTACLGKCSKSVAIPAQMAPK